MQRKVFIGIDLDPHVKTMLVKAVSKWHNMPIKWHKEESLHISLIPIGWVNEDDVFEISDAIEAVTTDMSNFDIVFNEIVTISKDDSSNAKDAQLVRLEGDDSDNMRMLFEKLEDELGMPVIKKKHFKPLVTLGRCEQRSGKSLKSFQILM